MENIKKTFQNLSYLVGYKVIKLNSQRHLHRLGKQCYSCKMPIIHRETISVCQCYKFAHRKCLVQQIQKQIITQCTKVQCQQCKSNIQIQTNFQFYFQPRLKLKQLFLMSFYMIMCILSTIYLINFKNQQLQKFSQQNQQQKSINSRSFFSIQEFIVMVVLSVFGCAFWMTFIGIFFKKRNQIFNIKTTNAQIKVSAFQDLQMKIKEQSQQQINIKKLTQTDL